VPSASRICARPCANPAHFEIISSGRLFDCDESDDLLRDNAELIGIFRAEALRLPTPKDRRGGRRSLRRQHRQTPADVKKPGLKP
jgi:hypothetical protein